MSCPSGKYIISRVKYVTPDPSTPSPSDNTCYYTVKDASLVRQSNTYCIKTRLTFGTPDPTTSNGTPTPSPFSSLGTPDMEYCVFTYTM